MFEFKNITYALGNDQARHITVSGAVGPGEVLIVRGPSGAGKSTLLRILSRLQAGAGGQASLQGQGWLQILPTVWRAKVHYLAQRAVIFDGTVAENLARPFETRLGSQKVLDPGRAREIMGRLLLPPELWDQDAKTLSGGEASRLAFTRALLMDPAVLLLDEPTAALDEPARQALYRVLAGWLKQGDRAALLISHNSDYLQLGQISYLDIKPLEGGH